MNLAKEIETLYKMVSQDESEDALSRLLLIARQWDLPFRHDVILLSNKFYSIQKKLQPGEEMDDDFIHEFNLEYLRFLDEIRLDEMLGMKSLRQLIEDLTEARQFAVDIEQQLTLANKEIAQLKNRLEALST